MPMFEDLRQDLRYATRTLTRERVFAAAAVLMLALGIGANSAMFALVDAILLRPLPFPEPDRLVMLWEQTPASPRTRVSPINLLDWKARSRTFEGMAAYVPNVAGMVLAGEDGNAETVPRQWVSSGIFDVLGVRPVVGRTFLPSDDTERATVVVLTRELLAIALQRRPGHRRPQSAVGRRSVDGGRRRAGRGAGDRSSQHVGALDRPVSAGRAIRMRDVPRSRTRSGG